MKIPHTSSVRSLFPWWAKILIKLALVRLGVRLRQRVWRRFGLFVHGDMADPAYALDVFEQHLRSLDLPSAEGLRVLELGPGDSLATDQIARAFGASDVLLVDVEDSSTRDPSVYARVQRLLVDRGLEAPEMPLAFSNGSFLSDGLASLRSLPDSSVDLVVSQAVLEHILLQEFPGLVAELRRVIKPGGMQSHVVDFRDHLADSLHSLRVPGRIWESSAFRRAGFYTNRLRLSQVVQAFSNAGFLVETTAMTVWDAPPVARSKLRYRYAGLSEDDLTIAVARLKVVDCR